MRQSLEAAQVAYGWDGEIPENPGIPYGPTMATSNSRPLTTSGMLVGEPLCPIVDYATAVPGRTVPDRIPWPRSRWTDSRLAEHILVDSAETVRTVSLEKYRCFPQKYAVVCSPLNVRLVCRKLMPNKEFVASRLVVLKRFAS
jgi:hypothetical protein